MGYGPDPVLPEPQHKLIPTVKIARPVGWKAGATPIAAADLKVTALAVELDHPRLDLRAPERRRAGRRNQYWRRGRDSTPRNPCGLSGFQDRYFVFLRFTKVYYKTLCNM